MSRQIDQRLILKQIDLPTCLTSDLWLEHSVLFSCKITNSVMTYLDRRGEDLEVLNEKCDWPSEFLRDPSSWLEADKMENLLKIIQEEYGAADDGDEPMSETIMAAAGHQCKDLRSWGVLDSVLRMVQSPKDLFAQPERFLSYFVSPAPPVAEVQREHTSVGFVLPVSEMQFPFVTGFLRAALEALPTYIAKPMASVGWDNSRVTITWTDTQASLFGEGETPDMSLNPELVRNILHNLESSQKQLEEMKRDLIQKDEEIAMLRAEAQKQTVAKPPRDQSSPETVVDSDLDALGLTLHNLYRLGDYVARGQQLVTLLVGQGRETPQVKEAMRRVDWEFVALEGPRTVRKLVGEIQRIQDHGLVVAEEAARRAQHSSKTQLRNLNVTQSATQKSFDGFSGHV